MRVCEIFTSIQGESSYAGLACTFVRLSGCNLRCVYCDTAYAYEEGTEMSVPGILERVSEAEVQLVEITGGEPLLDSETPGLAQALLERGFEVLVETNGSRDISVLPDGAVRIMDIKTPGSGMSGYNRVENIRLLRPSDEVKFVLGDEEDYHWSLKFIREHGLEQMCGVLLSPVYGRLDMGLLVEWMLRDRVRARLNLQLHKYIFGADIRGV